MFALVDCNNFYVSCERVFRPDLVGRPVAVLSNNDGCIVARSEEVKALGVGFGLPVFQFKHLLARHRVVLLSSNYTLYGDMSRRVMNTLADLAADLEIYSIDEAFLRLSPGQIASPEVFGPRVVTTVRRHTGIPVSVGIAPTKTLAKAANRLAKIHRSGFHVLQGTAADDRDLASLPVEDVWGVGSRFAEFLRKNSVETARDLRDAPREWIRRRLKLPGLRTVLELAGQPCLELEHAPSPQQAILCSRSFGRDVRRHEDLAEAVALFASRVAVRLRRQHSLAGWIQVFTGSNRFREGAQYAAAPSRELSPPTAHTPTLVQIALDLLAGVYRPGFRYKKAGVMVACLVPEEASQLDLFNDDWYDERQRRLMAAVDGINARFGEETVTLAATGLTRPWRTKRELVSPRYTTRWEDLPRVR